MRLNINIDHVATLRNQRDTEYPSVIRAAENCLGAGADGITVHLREDRRHIRDNDVATLRGLIPPDRILNLEMAASLEMTEIACSVAPTAVTLVPERREERTTEGGLDVVGQEAHIAKIVAQLKAAKIRVSLFIEATPTQVEASYRVGAEQIEFHTGHYCDSSAEERVRMLPKFIEASELAHRRGLALAAGHGLNCENVGPIARLPHMEELNIGHSVISDAVFVGLAQAVRDLQKAIQLAVARG